MGLHELIWDDEYTGDRWTYAMAVRPPSIGTHPDGEIIGARRAHVSYPHGTVDYPRELTCEDRQRYTMLLLAGPTGSVGQPCAIEGCRRTLTPEDLAESGAVGVCCACTNYGSW